MSGRFIVSYFLGYKGRQATLHEEGCLVLTRVRADVDSGKTHVKVMQLSVVEAELYAKAKDALPEGEYPEARLCRVCHKLGPRIEMAT